MVETIEHGVGDLRDTIKHTEICAMGVTDEEERENGEERLF